MASAIGVATTTTVVRTEDFDDFFVTDPATLPTCASDSTSSSTSTDQRSCELLFEIRAPDTGITHTGLGLLDTGTSRSQGTAGLLDRLKVQLQQDDLRIYNTAAGLTRSTQKFTIPTLCFPEIASTRSIINTDVCLMEKKLGRYDAIFGIDLMQRLGMDCCFSDLSIKWDGQEMPMHPKGFWNNPKLHSYRSYHRESAHVQALIGKFFKLPAVKLKFITTNVRIVVELHGTTNQVNKFYFTLVAMKLRPSFNTPRPF